MARRIVIEEPCDHGNYDCDQTVTYPDATEREFLEGLREYPCLGGSRRVLTPGSYVLVEKVDGEWPAIEIDGRSVLGPVMAQTLADILAEEGAP